MRSKLLCHWRDSTREIENPGLNGCVEVDGSHSEKVQPGHMKNVWDLFINLMLILRRSSHCVMTAWAWFTLKPPYFIEVANAHICTVMDVCDVKYGDFKQGKKKMKSRFFSVVWKSWGHLSKELLFEVQAFGGNLLR